MEEVGEQCSDSTPKSLSSHHLWTAVRGSEGRIGEWRFSEWKKVLQGAMYGCPSCCVAWDRGPAVAWPVPRPRARMTSSTPRVAQRQSYGMRCGMVYGASYIFYPEIIHTREH